MKRIAVSVAVLFAASQIQAQPEARTAEVIPAAPAKPGAAGKTAANQDENKQEAEPIIPGVTITRANGTFLGLEVEGGNFKLSFYDKKRKPMTVDVTRATARWPNPRAPGDNRTVLNPRGPALVGSKPVVPPFTFMVYLTLLQGDGDEAKAVESFVVPFHG